MGGGQTTTCLAQRPRAPEEGKSYSPQAPRWGREGGGRRRVQRLTQGVGGHPREDHPVRGKEDGALSRQQCGSPSGAPRATLTPIWQQVDAQAVQHTLLIGQQAWPQQFRLLRDKNGTSDTAQALGPRSPARSPLTFWMGGSLLLSRCTASRVSMCIWTMSGRQSLSYPGPPMPARLRRAFPHPGPPYLAP